MSAARDPSTRKRPLLLILGALLYAVAGVGIVPLAFFLKSQDALSDTTAWDMIVAELSGLSGVFYHLSAAACAWLLLTRSRNALWPAACVAVWVAYVQIVGLVRRPPEASFGMPFFVAWGYVCVYAWFFRMMLRWRKQGVLT